MNMRNSSSIWLASFLLLALTLGGCSKSAEETAPDATGKDATGKSASGRDAKKGGGLFSSTKPVTVPEGTAIAVVLDQALSTNGSHSGEEFAATLSEPIVIDGATIAPKDARVKGRVLEAVESGRLQTPAKISLTLSSVQIGGSWHDIETGQMTLQGKSHKTRDIEIIGGGSALGAIIGAVAGHGKGAAIGAAAGAGAGVAGAAATGKKDITLPAEARLSFKLRQPFTVNVKS
jgi:hypothetical protein